ncbi:hypothetical protein TNCT_278361 [Trichonephila clavata]|uniref:C2H2-type domain-containing protein n=1 Tax=Trichonephila clavata TaxID=2740835 RepID=A0A8X6EXV4_TRICU|nr:hypothetical protein TNCT_278361 [Trichonephila clavata]
MDQSNKKYWCETCNLQFKDYKQHLSHKYLQHDKQELQPVIINNDGGEFKNFSNNFETYSQTDIGKTFFKEQLHNNTWKHLARDVFNNCFNFTNHEATHHGTLNGRKVMPSSSKNVPGNIQEPRNRNLSIAEGSAKELSVSFKCSKNKIGRLDGNSHINTSQPLMSTERKPMELYTHDMKEQLNRNQSSLSEHSQMQLFKNSNNQQINFNQPCTPSRKKQIIENNLQVNRYQSFECNPIQFSTYQMNQHLHTNELIVAHELSEMEFCKHGMNPQSSANERAFTDTHESNSMANGVSSPQHRRINKFELNLQQHSEKNPGDLDFVDRSFVIYNDSNYINKEILDERGVRYFSQNPS